MGGSHTDFTVHECIYLIVSLLSIHVMSPSIIYPVSVVEGGPRVVV